MNLHRKKKVEIVAEAVLLPQLLEMIETAGGRGYTVVPDVSGSGNRGVRGGSSLSDAFRNVLIIVVASEPVALSIVERAHDLLGEYAGILFISDVEVVREEHF